MRILIPSLWTLNSLICTSVWHAEAIPVSQAEASLPFRGVPRAAVPEEAHYASASAAAAPSSSPAQPTEDYIRKIDQRLRVPQILLDPVFINLKEYWRLRLSIQGTALERYVRHGIDRHDNIITGIFTETQAAQKSKFDIMVEGYNSHLTEARDGFLEAARLNRCYSSGETSITRERIRGAKRKGSEGLAYVEGAICPSIIVFVRLISQSLQSLSPDCFVETRPVKKYLNEGQNRQILVGLRTVYYALERCIHGFEARGRDREGEAARSHELDRVVDYATLHRSRLHHRSTSHRDLEELFTQPPETAHSTTHAAHSSSPLENFETDSPTDILRCAREITRGWLLDIIESNPTSFGDGTIPRKVSVFLDEWFSEQGYGLLYRLIGTALTQKTGEYSFHELDRTAPIEGLVAALTGANITSDTFPRALAKAVGPEEVGVLLGLPCVVDQESRGNTNGAQDKKAEAVDPAGARDIACTGELVPSDTATHSVGSADDEAQESAQSLHLPETFTSLGYFVANIGQLRALVRKSNTEYFTLQDSLNNHFLKCGKDTMDFVECSQAEIDAAVAVFRAEDPKGNELPSDWDPLGYFAQNDLQLQSMVRGVMARTFDKERGRFIRTSPKEKLLAVVDALAYHYTRWGYTSLQYVAR